jgi:branched-chain amino acid aminotransferase
MAHTAEQHQSGTETAPGTGSLQGPDVRVWLNGRIVTADEARLPHLTHAFHYGLAAFEGIRSYQQRPGQGAIFRLREHIKRLLDSAHIATIDAGLRFTLDELCSACVETLKANRLDAAYLRPVVYIGEGAMGIGARDNPIHVMIAAWKWGAYLGEEGLQRGIKAKISAFQRPGHATVMSKAKITGQYVNSIMAKREAMACGADEAILVNEQGYIAEASGENLFMVQQGRLVTPPLGMNILAGITRATILQVARDLGVETVERMFARDELYCAEEVFLTGTAAEVTPVREVDGRRIGAGSRGPLTEQLQRRYFETVLGREARYASWLTPYSI